MGLRSLLSSGLSWASSILQVPLQRMGDLAQFMAFGEVAAEGATPTSIAGAVQIGAVHTCWKILGEEVAALPVHVMQRAANGREVVADHPLAWLVNHPSRELSRYDLMERLVVSMAATGRSACQVVRSFAGDPLELVPLDVDKVVPPETPDGPWGYKLDDGKVQALDREELWLSAYFLGLSPLSLMRRQLEEAASAETAARALFRNSAAPGGALEFPQKLSPEQRESLRASWNERHRGPNRAFSVAILDQGITFKPFTLNNRDAQFLEQRRFGREEISAIYRVPLHLLNDMTGAKFNNVEHQGIALVKHCLRHWAVRLEMAMDRDLLTDAERRAGLFFRFNLDAVLRGDYASRTQGHTSAIAGGLLTPNEARALEDLPPVAGGDSLLLPLNMRPSDAPWQTAPTAAPDPEESDDDAADRA